MTDMLQLFSVLCPECEGAEFVLMGIRDGYIYFVCLNDDCGETIRFNMRHLEALSYPNSEVDIDQEPIRFEFPDTETDKPN